jgi:hypothetical protein
MYHIRDPDKANIPLQKSGFQSKMAAFASSDGVTNVDDQL